MTKVLQARRMQKKILTYCISGGIRSEDMSQVHHYQKQAQVGHKGVNPFTSYLFIFACSLALLAAVATFLIRCAEVVASIGDHRSPFA